MPPVKEQFPILVDGASTVTIADTASLSDAEDLAGGALVGVITPATLAGTSLTFQASADGTNFYNLYNADGTEYTVTISTSRWTILPPADFAGIRWIKLRTGTAGSPQVQNAARTLTLVARPV